MVAIGLGFKTTDTGRPCTAICCNPVTKTGGFAIGRPAAMQENTISEDIFNRISKNMLSQLLIRNKELPETEIIKITTMSGCLSQK